VTKRLSSAERREQLLGIMRKRYAGASCQAEFTAELIAADAGVSSVLVYRLIGDEFMELRGTLAGGRRPPSTVVAELRAENKRLQRENRELKVQRKTDTERELAEAYQLIEEQDELIRGLESRNKLLEERLKGQGTVVVEIPISESKSRTGPR
jgi:AraC-like DNA-binding protein